MARPVLNPTITGAFAVLVWGLAIPVARFIESRIGVMAMVGTVYTSSTVLGLLTHVVRRQPFPDRAIFRNPFFYARWFCFIIQMPCIMTAVMIVQKPHVPLVILLNYIWPTAIILFSILVAGVSVKRRVVFIAGTLVVLAALAIEILQSGTVTFALFAQPRDRLAYGMAFIGALCWGMYSALTKRAGHETGGSAVVPLFQSTLALALPLSFLPGVATWENLTPELAGFLGLWCLLQFLAFLTWDIGMRLGNIVMLSLFADFIPWLSLTTSHVLLGIEIGQRTVLSALCLVAGAMMVRYGTLARRIKQDRSELESLAPTPPIGD